VESCQKVQREGRIRHVCFSSHNKPENIRALLDARQAGKTRHVGYSGDGEAALWAIASGVFDTLQTSFNLVDQSARLEVLPKARAAGMGVIVKRPIANAAWNAPRGSGATREGYRRGLQALLDLGPIPGAPEDRIALALGFTLAHEEVDTAIVGTRNPAHMRANIATVEDELPLPAEVVRELHRRYDRA
jgi:aryl-alcohol dehydrogenase-like predicted oxidoreductase